MGVSLKPRDAIETGLIDDVDVTLKAHKFVLWDYAGKVPVPTPALCVEMEDGEGATHVQYYSAGDSKNFQPSADGKTLEAMGSQTGVNKSSNCFQYLSSIINAGFPEDRMGDNITVLDGIKAHVKRIPQQERAGLVRLQSQAGQAERKMTVLIVSQIHEIPGEKKGPKGVATKGAGKATPSAVSGDGAVSDELRSAIQMFIVERAADPKYAGKLEKAKISQLAFKHCVDNKLGAGDRQAFVKLASDQAFLGEEGQPWQYDAATGTVIVE